jgi:hypothetical protein
MKTLLFLLLFAFQAAAQPHSETLSFKGIYYTPGGDQAQTYVNTLQMDQRAGRMVVSINKGLPMVMQLTARKKEPKGRYIYTYQGKDRASHPVEMSLMYIGGVLQQAAFVHGVNAWLLYMSEERPL